MSTSVEGRVVRSVGPDTFADITTTPLVIPAGVTRDGLLFDGLLMDAEVFAIWEPMTSVDDPDQARRAAGRDLEPCCHAVATLPAYVLGDPSPDPPPHPPSSPPPPPDTHPHHPHTSHPRPPHNTT